MSADNNPKRWAIGGGAAVLVIVGASMLSRFYEPGNLGWDVFLIVSVLGLFAAAFSIQRFVRLHGDEIGEARFDTRNKNHG